jgi:hypothetical protein
MEDNNSGILERINDINLDEEEKEEAMKDEE